MHKRKILILIIVGLVAYGNSLFNSFLGDDNFTILQNDFITSWGNFPRLFSKSYLTKADDLFFESYRRQDTGSGELSYRPVVTLSYMVDYFFWKLNPLGYHLVNILLHILNAILLYLFVLLLFKNNSLALISSLFFCTHPINTAAVNHISFREELLVVFFFLSAFILFIKYKNYHGLKKTGLYLGSCLLFSLALFSKEIAVTFPLMIMLYDFYFEFNTNIKKIISSLKSRYLGYIIVTIFYLVIYFFVFAPIDKMSASYAGGNIYTHLLTTIKIFARYITEFFIPLNISVIPAFYSPIAASIFNYEVLFSAALLVLFGIIGFRSYSYSKLISFGIFWFFITILPVSNIIPLVSMFAFRYMYLPEIGICLVLAIVCRKLANLRFLKRTTPTLDKILIISIVGFYIVITIPQNIFWRNEISFNKNQIMYYSSMPNPYKALGQCYIKQGFYHEAIMNLKRYIKYRQSDPIAYNDLGVGYNRLGMHDKAISEFNKAIKLRPSFTAVYNNLGVVYLDKQEPLKAIEFFNKAIELDPDYTEAYNNLAVAYSDSGQYEEGYKFFSKALEIDPNHSRTKYNLKILEKFLKKQNENK